VSVPAAVAAELRKTVTLSAAHVALAVTVLGTVGITLLNALNKVHGGQSAAGTSPADVAFAAVPLGTVGAVILGVVVISSEYTANSPDAGGGQQITATLTATPRRLAVLAAKALTVLLLVGVTAAVTMAACLALASLAIGNTATVPENPGDIIARTFGTALYWALMGLLALGITILTRSGILPLIVLIANSSVVSVSLLLSKLTPLARYLPDLAGMRLFYAGDHIAVHDPLDPLTGGLVMTAWALGLLAVSAVVFTRRDA
jgi:hypothetical protein